MIIAGTGHRPDKLGGYGYKVHDKLVLLAEKQLKKITPEKVISGMALGWDQALAEAAIKLSIPLIAAIPFKGQESIWPQTSQEKYNAILLKATKIEVVCEGGYAPNKMQIRNMWMVDACDALLALFDGSNGGTGNCVKYATSKEKTIINCWNDWLEIREA